jgi:hypothetical protein
MQNKINDVKSDPRQLWRTVNGLLHTPDVTSWYHGGDTLSIASGLSKFFVDKINRVNDSVRNSLRTVLNTLAEPLFTRPATIFTSFDPVMIREVEKLIHAAPSKTSPIDILPIRLFKDCADLFAIPIAHIANRSFSTGTFPHSFKFGLVTPLLKKPNLDTADFKNFRPITNLSTISKILERLALARIKHHLVSSPNFCPHQSAYRTAHSTETAMVKIVDDLLCHINEGSTVALISLDISAAFDTVNHATLLRRLRSEFGVRGKALDWVQSYLSKRSFSVRVGDSTCPSVSVQSGVPQGSVLGPILFTTYISPVGRLVDRCQISYHKYADDTQLYTALKSSPGVNIKRLGDCVEKLQIWFWQNNLLLNPDKSEVAYFGTHQRLRKSTLPLSISLGGKAITVAKTVKILGVKLDEHLTFDEHINEVVRACNYHLRALRHIRCYVTKGIARTVACSIIGSRIDYCNALLYGANKVSLAKLQRVQNNAARVVCNIRRGQQQSADDLLRELHFLPVASRINFKVALLCYKAYKLGQPQYLNSLLAPHAPARDLRSSNQDLLETNVDNHTLKLAHSRFSLAAPAVWNSLPLAVRSAGTVDTFKSRLKTHLFRSAV